MIEFLLAALIQVNWLNVAGEWDAYHLTETDKNWFSQARSKGKGNCCSLADGHPAEDWEHKGKHYRVKFRGKWYDVPDDALVTDQRNPVHVPVIWLTQLDEVRCFAPGPEG